MHVYDCCLTSSDSCHIFFVPLLQVCLCYGGVGLVLIVGAHLGSAVEDGNLLLDQRSAL